MANRSSSRLPFLIVSHEAVVVRAEEWLTTKKDSKHGDNFGEKQGVGCRGEKGESSSSVVGRLVRSGSIPIAANVPDVEMMSETSQPLLLSFKLDGQCFSVCLLCIDALTFSVRVKVSLWITYFSSTLPFPLLMWIFRGFFVLIVGACE